MNTVWEKRRKRLFEIIEIGSNYDAVCWGYDFFNTFTILLNLTVSIMYTFDNMELKYGPLLLTLERLTVAFFAIDFVLRIFTAKYLYPDVTEPRAISKYLFSFSSSLTNHSSTPSTASLKESMSMSSFFVMVTPFFDCQRLMISSSPERLM